MVRVRDTLQLTVGQPVGLSWCRAPSGAHDQMLIYFLKVTVSSIWGAFSDERSGLSFPNMEGHVPVFICPRNRVAQLYPQTLGSLFVASDSQGYGGGIRSRLHTGLLPGSGQYPRYVTSAWAL
jgi:hypothetical protein